MTKNIEELKKEARKDLGLRELPKVLAPDLYEVLDDYIDRATQLERKRCAEIARAGWCPYGTPEDKCELCLVCWNIATAIEKGEV